MLHKIKQLLMGKQAEQIEKPKDMNAEEYVEEYMYMGDGTVESIYTPKTVYEKRVREREAMLAKMLVESQCSVRESKGRMTALRSGNSSSSRSSSSVSSTSDSIIAAAVYTSSYDSSSYDSGSSCSSSSSSCD